MNVEGCELSADAELCVRWCPNVGGKTPGAIWGLSYGDANGSVVKYADVIAGCGVRGPRGDASGFDRRRILGVSGSANGSEVFRSCSAIMPANADCDETLLLFLRSLFRSLFLLDECLAGSPVARKLWGSLVE
jgi:hypothetical protein